MRLKSLPMALIAAIAAGAVVHAAPAGPIAPVPARLALKAAGVALTTCADQGQRVTVTIIDRESVVRTLLVGDGAGPIGISTSRRKAYTAVALGVSSRDYGKRAAGYPGPPIDPELIGFSGGLPIMSHGAVIGAIGVGGADSPDKDEACAQAGLDAVKDMLN